MLDEQKTHVTFVRNPKLQHIEARFSSYRNIAFKKHFHETYAIGVVEQGVSSFFRQGTIEMIGMGTIALINPGEVHACNPQSDTMWAYKMFTLLLFQYLRQIMARWSDTQRYG